MNDNLFYRSGRKRVSRNVNPRSKTKFSFSFKNWKLFFAGLTVVCGILLVGKGFMFALDSIKSSKIEELASVKVEVGDVQRQTGSLGDFVQVYENETVWENDVIRTLSNSRATVKLFDGTILRLDESTSVRFVSLVKDGDDSTIDIKVDTGNVWVKAPQVLVGTSNLNVETKYLRAKFNNSVVSLTSNLPEYVRVISGLASVDVLDLDGSVMTSENIEAGNQLVLSNDEFESLRSGEDVILISGIDDRFKFSKWYEWNKDMDQNPIFDDNAVIDPSDTSSEIDTPVLFDSDLNGEFIQKNEDGVDPAIQPVITFPKNNSLIDDTELVEIVGTVPVNTSQVMVVSYEDGESSPNSYILKGFKEGDSEFLYRAKYDPLYGNLEEGLNKFEVVAIDARGQESPATVVEFEYKKPVVKEEEKTPSTSEKLSSLELDSTLTAPVIDTVNDVAYFEGFVLDEKKGVVEGTIGAWAEKVVLNNWELSLYEPYSGEFRYILSPGFGNVVDGNNTLKIYGIDKNGKRGPVATFVIEYDYEEIE